MQMMEDPGRLAQSFSVRFEERLRDRAFQMERRQAQKRFAEVFFSAREEFAGKCKRKCLCGLKTIFDGFVFHRRDQGTKNRSIQHGNRVLDFSRLKESCP